MGAIHSSTFHLPFPASASGKGRRQPVHSVRFLTIISAVLFATSFLPASGAMLYDEATQGDLPQEATAPVFQAPVGTNVVSGAVSYIQAALDIDYFSFVVQSEQTASNLTFTFSNQLLVGNEQVTGHVWVYAGTVPTGVTYLTDILWIARAQGSIYGLSTPSPVVINTGSLGPGAYTVSVEPNGRSFNGGSVPYSASFDVAAIPEQSTALLGALAAAMTLARCRPAPDPLTASGTRVSSS